MPVFILIIATLVGISSVSSENGGDSRSKQKCGNDAYTCDDGSCIPLTQLCDGSLNCKDYSDERQCDFVEKRSQDCTKGNFHCKNLLCIAADLKCNGNNDCGDNSDEENCASGNLHNSTVASHTGDEVISEVISSTTSRSEAPVSSLANISSQTSSSLNASSNLSTPSSVSSANAAEKTTSTLSTTSSATIKKEATPSESTASNANSPKTLNSTTLTSVSVTTQSSTTASSSLPTEKTVKNKCDGVCQNGGTCFIISNGDDNDEALCYCLQEWEGKHCEKHILECSDHCENGGTCYGRKIKSCSCPPHFTGKRCEQCLDLKCQNGGICRNLALEEGNIDLKCSCAEGFYGEFCELCQCENGNCSYNSNTDMVKCICEPGWTGNECDICIDNKCSLNACRSIKCENGGSCYESNGSPLCNCSAGWRGQFCDKKFECDIVCYNGGKCIESPIVPGTFFCHCSEGITGDFCESSILPAAVQAGYLNSYSGTVVGVIVFSIVIIGAVTLYVILKRRPFSFFRHRIVHERLHNDVPLEEMAPFNRLDLSFEPS